MDEMLDEPEYGEEYDRIVQTGGIEPPSPQPVVSDASLPASRAYQQELLEESLKRNLIIALDTGSGKTHIAVLRMKLEAERVQSKVSF